MKKIIYLTSIFLFSQNNFAQENRNIEEMKEQFKIAWEANKKALSSLGIVISDKSKEMGKDLKEISKETIEKSKDLAIKSAVATQEAVEKIKEKTPQLMNEIKGEIHELSKKVMEATK